ncbi:ATP-binding protein [Streptomyces sp. NPDC006129]|uniref:ATP-binding protein n=1 Tax=Streptomyces sp. NPDC006129 TaxID=3155348 RepID=UPI0033BCEE74
MSDSAFPTRPVAPGRRRRRPPQIDAFTLHRVRRAVALPLLLLAAVLGAVFIAWSTGSVAAGWLVASFVCGLLGVAFAAVRGTRRAAGALQAAADEARAAELAAISGAAAAVERSVLRSADELCRGGRPPLPERQAPRQAGLTAEIDAALSALQVQAISDLIRVHDRSQSAVLLSMLHQFSKREHALVGRALEKLDALQDLTEDPDQLDALFKLDHLVTRMRRWVESKAMVAGESLRSAREPVSVMHVLRGANQEILHYSRVTVAAGTVGAELGLPRHVGPDMTHLLAELVENATQFSDPTTKVQVRAQRVALGLAVEVEDRVVIPMRPTDRERNHLLADPHRVDVSAEVSAGRLGLLTTAMIARRHGISVELKENPTGGTTALVVVPNRLLVAMPAPVVPPAPPQPPAAPAPRAATSTRRSSPAPAQARARPVSAVVAGSAPPLPQRVVREPSQMPATSRPMLSTKGPRYDLAGAFQGGIKAARAHDSTDASGPSTAPPPHP